MTQNPAEIPKLLKLFRHKTNGIVKFHEVDAFQVVHNLKYLEWTEIARVEYCRELGISILPEASNPIDFVNQKFYIFIVHSEVNYFQPATFFDKYIVYSRVAKIGKSSMTFEHIITKENGEPLCIHQAVEVYVDTLKQPMEIDNSIRELIFNYEVQDSVVCK
jgi:YbgC/YbaW family acyl-CoA thioester hydrolase